MRLYTGLVEFDDGTDIARAIKKARALRGPIGVGGIEGNRPVDCHECGIVVAKQHFGRRQPAVPGGFLRLQRHRFGEMSARRLQVVFLEQRLPFLRGLSGCI